MLDSVALAAAAPMLAPVLVPPSATYWIFAVVLLFLLALFLGGLYIYLKEKKTQEGQEPEDGDNREEHHRMGERLDTISRSLNEVQTKQAILEANQANIQKDITTIQNGVTKVHERIDMLFSKLAELMVGK